MRILMIASYALIAAFTSGAAATAKDFALVMSNAEQRGQWYSRGADGYMDMLSALERDGFQVSVLERSNLAQAHAALSALQAQIGTADRLIVVLDGKFVSAEYDSWMLAEDARSPKLFEVGSTGVSAAAVAAMLSENPGRSLLVLSRQGYRTPISTGLRRGTAGVSAPQGVSVLAALRTRLCR